jgi:hypothetical protein
MTRASQKWHVRATIDDRPQISTTDAKVAARPTKVSIETASLNRARGWTGGALRAVDAFHCGHGQQSTH